MSASSPNFHTACRTRKALRRVLEHTRGQNMAKFLLRKQYKRHFSMRCRILLVHTCSKSSTFFAHAIRCTKKWIIKKRQVYVDERTVKHQYFYESIQSLSLRWGKLLPSSVLVPSEQCYNLFFMYFSCNAVDYDGMLLVEMQSASSSKFTRTCPEDDVFHIPHSTPVCSECCKLLVLYRVRASMAHLYSTVDRINLCYHAACPDHLISLHCQFFFRRKCTI